MSPEEKRAAVRELFVAGNSYVEIAEGLGAPNRHCVAGVVSRLRKFGELAPTPGRKKAGADGGALVKVNTRKTREKRELKASGLAAVNIAVRTEHRAEAPGIAISRAAAFEPIPGIRPVTLMQFGPFTCKWPVDGIDGPARLFCGAEKEPEHSFCAAHRRLAYTSQNERAA